MVVFCDFLYVFIVFRCFKLFFYSFYDKSVQSSSSSTPKTTNLPTKTTSFQALTKAISKTATKSAASMGKTVKNAMKSAVKKVKSVLSVEESVVDGEQESKIGVSSTGMFKFGEFDRVLEIGNMCAEGSPLKRRNGEDEVGSEEIREKRMKKFGE